ncbi:hypothetical protein [Gymnodinialimonas hymeniacidonis]|uniref:hypothetical protein n=1 Tax=Gymnodinialimonas hymeniacidonis TaxID=3126508 RepID=UPI0034C6064F
MSAPDTNLDRQARRHKPALWGIAIAVGAAAIFAITAFLVEGVPADEQAAGVPAATDTTQ